MGYSCKMENVMLAISALESIFDDMGVDLSMVRLKLPLTMHMQTLKKNQINLLKICSLISILIRLERSTKWNIVIFALFLSHCC